MSPPSPPQSSPFEGPEKLLELWFAPSPHGLGRGLRAIKRSTWENMLEIVQCKVLNVIEGEEVDAYLLSESSLFVAPHRLILKTCGTTLNLLGLPRILSIALNDPELASPLPSVYRAFYSRKTFMFPTYQQTPHSSWDSEVTYLDGVFQSRGEGKGSAYCVGKVNGDYWLLWMICPGEISDDDSEPTTPVLSQSPTAALWQDYTIEILMSELAPESREPFFFDAAETESPHKLGSELSERLNLHNIFPADRTKLDAYAFTPCGYSANALVSYPESSGEGYYTIHVTPEEGWSYASFECNVPLAVAPAGTKLIDNAAEQASVPDLQTIISHVVKVFRPGRLTMTLFVSSDAAEDSKTEAAVDAAHRAFKEALSDFNVMPSKKLPVNGHTNGVCRSKRYKRTDKINYEFGGYDLAFASFELR